MQNTSPRYLALLYIILGSIAFFFSFLITVEKIALIQDASYIPPCNISPFISCGSVMMTPQASLFGFPNSFLGIAGFTILITIGFALLAGATFRKWFWVCIQLGLLAALTFIFWLFFQSVYRIGALCPYCMIVWAMTIPLFTITLYHNFKNGYLPFFTKNERLMKISTWSLGIVFYLMIITAITIQFWPYWKTLF